VSKKPRTAKWLAFFVDECIGDLPFTENAQPLARRAGHASEWAIRSSYPPSSRVGLFFNLTVEVPMAISASTITPRRFRSDDVFFLTMVLLILVAVIVGFGQSYFVPGMIFAKLPNVLVHVHGALFVSWILLLVVQTVLVSVNRVQWHMRLGILGAALAPLMAS
jgi:hypothetical protein